MGELRDQIEVLVEERDVCRKSEEELFGRGSDAEEEVYRGTFGERLVQYADTGHKARPYAPCQRLPYAPCHHAAQGAAGLRAELRADPRRGVVRPLSLILIVATATVLCICGVPIKSGCWG